jgi:hypothetical protein
MLLKQLHVLPQRTKELVELISDKSYLCPGNDPDYAAFEQLDHRTARIAAVDAAIDLDYPYCLPPVEVRDETHMTGQLWQLEWVSQESDLVAHPKTIGVSKGEDVTSSELRLGEPKERNIVRLARRFVSDGS